jgi:hypothetical protein
VVWGEKFQTSSTNHQISSNNQYPNIVFRPLSLVWLLGFGDWLLFGAWDLVIEI